MSDPATYSPYNKTYKFILFQNQAYHERNKRNISPCVRSNLRHSISRNRPTNPEVFPHPRSSTSRSAWSTRAITSPAAPASSKGARSKRPQFLNPNEWSTRTGASRSSSRRRSATRMRRWWRGFWAHSARWSRISRQSTPSASTCGTRASGAATTTRASARTYCHYARVPCCARRCSSSTRADWPAASWKWTSRCR